MDVDGAGLMMWVYNPCPLKDPIRFTFLDWEMNAVCSFDFVADFQGWRTIRLKYTDMQLPDGRYYGDLKRMDRKTDVAGMVIRMPESENEGVLYIDRVSFTTFKLPAQLTPDKQLPFNNHSIDRMWQWCSMWKWEQFPPLELLSPSDEQVEMLSIVEQRLDHWAQTGNPGRIYTAGTLMPKLDSYIQKYGLKRTPDGSMTGAPLLSDDEYNDAKGEMRLRYIQEIVYWTALDYLYTGSTSNIQRAIDAMDHAIDQGFAYGASFGTNHHYGYQIRELFKGVWILREPL